jgi:hypothetical protein
MRINPYNSIFYRVTTGIFRVVTRREPERKVDNEIKKTFLQQANELHLKNIELSKSEIARVLSEQLNVRFETARDWLKKEWKSK